MVILFKVYKYLDVELKILGIKLIIGNNKLTEKVPWNI